MLPVFLVLNLVMNHKGISLKEVIGLLSGQLCSFFNSSSDVTERI